MTSGQAGGRVTCDACGRVVDVPRLRDLVGFAASPVASPPDDRAIRGRGLAVGGVATALAAAVLAASLGRLGVLFFPQPAGADEIRAALASTSPADVHAVWQTLSRNGVHRPATSDELRLQQFAARAAAMSRLLWGLAGIGGVVALAGIALGAAAAGSATPSSRGSVGGDGG
ncbi:MAG: hypothetical protein ACKO6E_11015 [Planctomycetota bacterium]